MTPPWMPFYVADYLADTGHLSTVEHGAYLLLIMHYWQSGGLPDDDKKLARITRLSQREWSAVKGTVAEFFDCDWRHSRIDEEMARAEDKITARSGAGTKGAESRWGKSGRSSRSQRLADARQKGTHTAVEWQAMLDIFGGCVKCGIRNEDLYGGKCLKDHILPLYQGGSDSIDNLQPMCRHCNSRKGAEDTDYRVERVPDWREQLTKRLANGSQTPGPSQPQSQEKKEEANASSKEKRQRRGERLPEDWAPTDEQCVSLHDEGFTNAELSYQLRKFRDHWAASAGGNAVKRDWAAAFRNWMRTSRERGGSNQAATASPQGVQRQGGGGLVGAGLRRAAALYAVADGERTGPRGGFGPGGNDYSEAANGAGLVEGEGHNRGFDGEVIGGSGDCLPDGTGGKDRAAQNRR